MVRDSSPATPAHLSSHLHAERAALQAFVTLLETEQQALMAGQTEQLLHLADNKTLAVQALTQLANARNSMLLAHGAASGPGSIDAWLEAHAADSLPVWQNIRQLAAQSQQINRSNGELIQARLRNNQQALTILRTAANGASGLYGPDGQPHLPTPGRTLGSG